MTERQRDRQDTERGGGGAFGKKCGKTADERKEEAYPQRLLVAGSETGCMRDCVHQRLRAAVPHVQESVVVGETSCLA